MQRCLVIFVLACWGCCHSALADSWDEPWHEEVVANSDSFGLYKVINTSKGILRVKQLKHLAGTKTPNRLEVSCCHLRRWASKSSNSHPYEAHHYFEKDQSYYLYLRNSKDNADDSEWSVATPTSGYAKLDESIGKMGAVIATYRHSLHQVLVSQEIYESTQICIFTALNEGACEDQTVDTFIEENLSEAVAILSPETGPVEEKRLLY